jgi:hypothetical protein
LGRFRAILPSINSSRPPVEQPQMVKWRNGSARISKLTCHLKIPQLGTFGPNCTGVVGHIPSWFSIAVVLFRYGLNPLWSRRPTWLRKFAAEECADGVSDEHIHSLKQKSWSTSTAFIFGLSITGLILGLYAIRAPDLDPVHTILVIPCVSANQPLERGGDNVQDINLSLAVNIVPDSRY